VHTDLWEYRVIPGSLAEFELLYGSRGGWVELFRTSPGYLGSELWQDPVDTTRFITIDRWESARARDDWIVSHQVEYEQLDRQGEALTVWERELGHFEVEQLAGSQSIGGLRSLADSVLDVIGMTPMIRLARLWDQPRGEILAKLDYLNPGGSKKDRIALRIIEEAEESGALRAGQAVVELTSGNTGTGLAIVCAVKGYPFIAVMSRGNSEERAQMMEALGAEVVLVDQADGSTPGHVSGEDLARVESEVRRIAIERSAFRADQFRLSGNANAHEQGTAAELWAQTGGGIDVFCEFVGTGGTFVGVSRHLKARNPDIRCYVVEPRGAAALAGRPITNPNHRIQGGGYAMTALQGWDSELIDGYLEIPDSVAVETARRLARIEGIFAGFSSGACVAAAERLLATEHAGARIAVVLSDTGLKYLSTDLWQDR
jgi:cysteine synthase A